MSIIDKSRNMYPDSINILKSLERYISSTCNITNLPARTLLTFQTSCSFPKRTRSLKKRTRAFKNLTCCFFHNGIYMPKRLTFPSNLSATPQTPCLSAFRLKDMHCEMFQPENILQKNDSPKIGRISARLKHSNPS